METIEPAKTGFAALVVIISYLGGKFNDLFWILCFLMLIDYITGYVSAMITGTRNSRIGLIGIFKKTMYIIFVIFGFILDIAIIKIFEQLSINFSFNDIGGISLGVVIMIFYIGNETISILENFEKMGLSTPKWLSKIGTLLKEAPGVLTRPLIKKGEQYIEELDKKEKESNDKSEKSDESIKE